MSRVRKANYKLSSQCVFQPWWTNGLESLKKTKKPALIFLMRLPFAVLEPRGRLHPGGGRRERPQESAQEEEENLVDSLAQPWRLHSWIAETGEFCKRVDTRGSCTRVHQDRSKRGTCAWRMETSLGGEAMRETRVGRVVPRPAPLGIILLKIVQ